MELAKNCFTVCNRRIYIKLDAITKLYNKSKAEIEALIVRISTDMSDEFFQREMIKEKSGYLFSQDGFMVLSLYLQEVGINPPEMRKRVIEQMVFLKTIIQCEEQDKNDALKRQQLRLLISDIAKKQKRPEAFVWYDFDLAWFNLTGVKLGQAIVSLKQTRPEYLLAIGRMDDALAIAHEMLEGQQKARRKKAG